MKNKHKLFKAALATSVAAGAMVVIAPANMNAAATTFKDLPATNDHYEPVKELAARGVIKGYEDGTYKPNASVTRGQAAKIIALSLGLDTKNVKNPGFKDISTSHAYYGEIAALVEAGIITGFPEDSTYRPGDTLTRAQMSKIISIAFGLPEETEITNTFVDVKTGHWYKGYVQTLVSHNITKGTTPTTFEPSSPVRRGQLASFVIRAEQAVNQGEAITSLEDGSFTTGSGTYKLSGDLQKLFSNANSNALVGANIKYTVRNGEVVSIQSLSITKDGATLDAGGAVVDGNLVISANNVTVKNVTVLGSLKIGNEAKESFKGEKLTVRGKTIVSSKKAYVASTVNVAANTNAAITFVDSVLGDVNFSQSGTELRFTGNGSVKNVVVEANGSVAADRTVKVETVTVSAGVTALTIDATVETLHIANTTTKLTLAPNAVIENIVLPAGVEASAVIANYEEVKGNIKNVDGEPNPDAGSGGGGGGGFIPTPPATPNPDPVADINAIIKDELSKIGGDVIKFNESDKTFTVDLTDVANSTLKEFADSVSADATYTRLMGKGMIDKVVISYDKKDFTVNISEKPASFDVAVQRTIKNINDMLVRLNKNTIDYETTTLAKLQDKEVTLTFTGNINNVAFKDVAYKIIFN